MTNPHDASDALVGYLYQCRYALLLGLRAIGESPDLELSFERFDDITFESSGDPRQLVQTKHHVSRKGRLGDASPDLWGTLRAWCRQIGLNRSLVLKTQFVLVTTATAPVGSAASLLGTGKRNEAEADRLLLAAATRSRSKTNAPAYASYLSLPEATRIALLRGVVILDGSPTIGDSHAKIVEEVYHAAGRRNVDLLVERLEGWWFERVIACLTGTKSVTIPVIAIDQRVDELREDFKRSALPVDFASASPSEEVVAELDRRPFVLQLRKIDVGPRRIEYAIRDYYRASEQRSRWAREQLLVDDELSSYDRRLIEAWQPRYAEMIEIIGADCSHNEKVKSGQALYRWVETEASFSLRSVEERFLTHGSYQMLANRLVVGWHPNYGDLPSSEQIGEMGQAERERR